jgi:electron transfer flavoprotein beta subunit
VKIAVFVKQAEDARSVRIESGTGKAKTSGEPVMNPADAHAVSDAIDLKEASGGEVVAVTLGSSSAREVVVDAMATGADGGIHVVADDAVKGDSRVTANALADAVRDAGFDIYLAGHSAVDFGAGQVHVQIAEALGIPHIANVVGVAADGSMLTIQRDLDGFADELEVQAPVMLILAERDDVPTRHPSLRGMMQAKRKPVQEVAASEEMSTPLQWSEPTAQRTSDDQIILEGEPAEEAAAKLAAWLREHRLVG